MDIIYSYTRKEAIEDGTLIDITNTSEAKEAGFKIPVCLTRSVYSLVEVPKELEGMQDFKGRLWDVCYMATLAFKRFKEDKHLVPFEVLIQDKTKDLIKYKLWLCFNESEGFTIMKPEDY